jgi:hypothetical protein
MVIITVFFLTYSARKNNNKTNQPIILNNSCPLQFVTVLVVRGLTKIDMDTNKKVNHKSELRDIPHSMDIHHSKGNHNLHNTDNHNKGSDKNGGSTCV